MVCIPSDILCIAQGLGVKFFLAFLVGCGLGFYFTRTVYLTLGVGIAFGLLTTYIGRRIPNEASQL